MTIRTSLLLHPTLFPPASLDDEERGEDRRLTLPTHAALLAMRAQWPPTCCRPSGRSAAQWPTRPRPCSPPSQPAGIGRVRAPWEAAARSFWLLGGPIDRGQREVGGRRGHPGNVVRPWGLSGRVLRSGGPWPRGGPIRGSPRAAGGSHGSDPVGWASRWPTLGAALDRARRPVPRCTRGQRGPTPCNARAGRKAGGGASMRREVAFVVNGVARTVEVEPRRLLVQLLREDLGLTGTHVGCDTSQCGACTVLVDGRAVKSCTMLAVQADGRGVTTIEGLARDGGLHPLQQAFWEKHGLQCGFCTPGMIMTAADLLASRARPRRGRASATPSRATSAAAPATTTSCGPSPGGGHHARRRPASDAADADPPRRGRRRPRTNRRPGLRTSRRRRPRTNRRCRQRRSGRPVRPGLRGQPASPAERPRERGRRRRRPAAAPRGRPLHHRHRHVPRRREAAGHGPRGDPAQPLRPRADRLGRHLRRAAHARRHRRLHRPGPRRPAAAALRLAGRRRERTLHQQPQHAAPARPRRRASGPARAWRWSSPRRPSRRPTPSRSSRSTCEPLPAGRRRRAGHPGRALRSSTRTRRSNVAFEWWAGDKDGTAAAIEAAEVVVRQRLVNQRLIPNPMEVRGAIGRYDPGTDEYTIWMSSQTPHIMRLLITAFVLGIPEHKVRVISPDIGGAFGTKIFLYTEWVLVAWAVKQLGGRPVKWVESRRENYVATIHGRDHITGHRGRGHPRRHGHRPAGAHLANLGGRLSTIGPGIPTTLYGRVLVGPYAIPNVWCEVTGVYTNTVFVDAYRGAGRPEATYVVERAMDLFAAEIGMDRAEVRRRNFLPTDAFPHATRAACTARGTARAGHRLGRLRARAGAGPRDGRLRGPRRGQGGGAGPAASYLGLGISSYIEICGVAPSKWIGAVGEGWGAAMWESANIRVHLTGKVVVTTGSQSAGPGPRDDHGPDRGERAGRARRGRPRQALRHAGRALRLRLVRLALARPWAARPSSRRPTRCARRRKPARGAHAGGGRRRHGATRTARTSCAARRTGPRPSPRSPSRPTWASTCRRAWSRSWTRPPTTTPPNCTWPFGTHIAIVEVDAETGAGGRSCATSRSMTWARRSTRSSSTASSTAASPRASGRRSGSVPSTTRRPAAVGLDARLRRAARVVAARLRARRDRHAVAGQPAGRQGRRRGGRHRQHAGRGQRGHRRALAAGHPPRGHAAHRPDVVWRAMQAAEVRP